MSNHLLVCLPITVEPHYNGTEGTDCIFALLPKSGVAIWAISVEKKQKKAEEKTFLIVIISMLSNSEIAKKTIANDNN